MWAREGMQHPMFLPRGTNSQTSRLLTHAAWHTWACAETVWMSIPSYTHTVLGLTYGWATELQGNPGNHWLKYLCSLTEQMFSHNALPSQILYMINRVPSQHNKQRCTKDNFIHFSLFCFFCSAAHRQGHHQKSSRPCCYGAKLSLLLCDYLGSLGCFTDSHRENAYFYKFSLTELWWYKSSTMQQNKQKQGLEMTDVSLNRWFQEYYFYIFTRILPCRASSWLWMQLL